MEDRNECCAPFFSQCAPSLAVNNGGRSKFGHFQRAPFNPHFLICTFSNMHKGHMHGQRKGLCAKRHPPVRDLHVQAAEGATICVSGTLLTCAHGLIKRQGPKKQGSEDSLPRPFHTRRALKLLCAWPHISRHYLPDL